MDVRVDVDSSSDSRVLLPRPTDVLHRSTSLVETRLGTDLIRRSSFTLGGDAQSSW